MLTGQPEPIGLRKMAEPRYNLVIVHTPGAQAITDWLKVAGLIRERAPDIEVRIANNRIRNSATRRWQVTRPSLVFSPYHLAEFRPLGGKVYAGLQYSKLDQFARFLAAKVPVPRTCELTFHTHLDPELWGPKVILKPLRGTFGQGVKLMDIAAINERRAELLKGNQRLIVQEFVDTGIRPFQYRVLTMFGRPLYAMSIYAEPESESGQSVDACSGVYRLTSNMGEKRKFIYDDDVLELALRMHAAIPEVPVQGADILRDCRTELLYAIEANPGGNVWHLSSDGGREAQRHLGMDYYSQFNALSVVADELLRRTRNEAC